MRKLKLDCDFLFEILNGPIAMDSNGSFNIYIQILISVIAIVGFAESHCLSNDVTRLHHIL